MIGTTFFLVASDITDNSDMDSRAGVSRDRCVVIVTEVMGPNSGIISRRSVDDGGQNPSTILEAETVEFTQGMILSPTFRKNRGH